MLYRVAAGRNNIGTKAELVSSHFRTCARTSPASDCRVSVFRGARPRFGGNEERGQLISWVSSRPGRTRPDPFATPEIPLQSLERPACGGCLDDREGGGSARDITNGRSLSMHVATTGGERCVATRRARGLRAPAVKMGRSR